MDTRVRTKILIPPIASSSNLVNDMEKMSWAVAKILSSIVKTGCSVENLAGIMDDYRCKHSEQQ